MKLVRNQPDKYFDALSAEQIKQKLRKLDHTICDKSRQSSPRAEDDQATAPF